MSGRTVKLSQRKQAAIIALITQPTVAEAARVANVRPNTLGRWKKEPAFDAGKRRPGKQGNKLRRHQGWRDGGIDHSHGPAKLAPVKLLSASRGKVQRAEPVAALYALGKVAEKAADEAARRSSCRD
jgi:hypothetical protein